MVRIGKKKGGVRGFENESEIVKKEKNKREVGPTRNRSDRRRR